MVVNRIISKGTDLGAASMERTKQLPDWPISGPQLREAMEQTQQWRDNAELGRPRDRWIGQHRSRGVATRTRQHQPMTSLPRVDDL